MTARLVLLTLGYPYGQRLAWDLVLAGAPLQAVVCVAPPPAPPPPPLPARVRLHLRDPRASLRRGIARVRRALTPPPYTGSQLSALAPRFVAAPPLNTPGLRALLTGLRPDHVLLGGVGILDAGTIAAAGCPIWNAHPALLPFARGVDVVAHSILRAVPVGGTVHRVDAGIDTGSFAERWLVPVLPHESLAVLRAKANRLGTRRLAALAARLAAGDAPLLRRAGRRSGYCRTLRARGQAAVEALVRDGRAAELYTSWRGALGGDEVPGELPAHPPVAVPWK